MKSIDFFDLKQWNYSFVPAFRIAISYRDSNINMRKERAGKLAQCEGAAGEGEKYE